MLSALICIKKTQRVSERSPIVQDHTKTNLSILHSTSSCRTVVYRKNRNIPSSSSLGPTKNHCSQGNVNTCQILAEVVKTRKQERFSKETKMEDNVLVLYYFITSL